ncbi:MAG: NAD-dependent epimerase/dehydratase family protein [Chloroflexi bacterium]|nr:MAG: NAD-dependent epimerase/dehydratase family protein [Chloroflexota bacterium]
MATVVVTGSTGAIGSATIAVLEKRRAQVVPLSRASVDLSSMASVRGAARELNRTVGHIDALLHIAAVFTPRYQKTTDGLELMLATNHLGPFLLLHSFGATKAANLMFTFELARRAKRWDVRANAFHPGVVRSELMREASRPVRFLSRLISNSPERAAQDLVDVALSPAFAGTTGWFFKGTRRIDPPKPTMDVGQQSVLWKRSAELVELEGGF